MGKHIVVLLYLSFQCGDGASPDGDDSTSPHEGEIPVDVPVEEHREFKDVQGTGN